MLSLIKLYTGHGWSRRYDWFAEMGLEWFAVPAVASMMLDVGGVQYTAAPFNGWYMSSEVASRDLCDVQRYNLLQAGVGRGYTHTNTQCASEHRSARIHPHTKTQQTNIQMSSASHIILSHNKTNKQKINCSFFLQEIGEKMGLETSSNLTLWKDEVNVEVNKAVLYSYEVSQGLRGTKARDPRYPHNVLKTAS